MKLETGSSKREDTKDIRAAPYKTAPCRKHEECRNKVCRDPHCEEWRRFANEQLRK